LQSHESLDGLPGGRGQHAAGSLDHIATHFAQLLLKLWLFEPAVNGGRADAGFGGRGVHPGNERTTIMASFEKPRLLKAALKMGLYGPAGSGKSFTSLLIAEGLARHTGKRVAYCDTEYGTAFYGLEVPQRVLHPEAFDFDVLHTKSVTEVLAAVRGLDPARYGVLVADSISHL
jgi:hypothetical protein